MNTNAIQEFDTDKHLVVVLTAQLHALKAKNVALEEKLENQRRFDFFMEIGPSFLWNGQTSWTPKHAQRDLLGLCTKNFRHAMRLFIDNSLPTNDASSLSNAVRLTKEATRLLPTSGEWAPSVVSVFSVLDPYIV
jgi:hypothetical protein